MIRDTLTKLSEKENFEEKISAINLLKSEKGDPFFGNKYGTKIIYEFSDYNCGYCKKIFYDLWEITEEFNDVKVIVKEFPILAESSFISAKAGISAHLQGKYSSFHKNLMSHRGKINNDIITEIARESEVDINKMFNSMNNKKVLDKLRKNIEIGKILGVKGTPALIIGNEIIPGAISKDEILSFLKKEYN